jgi:hypothetical protein
VEVTPELVQLDDDGLYKKLRLFYFLTDGKQYLKPRDKAKLSNLLNSKGQLWQPTANKALIRGQIDLLIKLDIVNVLMQPDREYRGADADLVKLKKRVIRHRYAIRTMFGIVINPAASAIASANQLLSIFGLKLNQVSRDKLADGKAGHRVYKFMPILVTDIRYQILQNWLKVDAQKLAQKLAEVIDISNTELDPPKIIINTITDAGSKLAGSDVVAIAPGPIAPEKPKAENIPMAIAPTAPKTPNAPSPNHKPSNKPTQPPKNTQPIDSYELRLKAYQRGWDGSPFSLMQYA